MYGVQPSLFITQVSWQHRFSKSWFTAQVAGTHVLVHIAGSEEYININIGPIGFVNNVGVIFQVLDYYVAYLKCLIS